MPVSKRRKADMEKFDSMKIYTIDEAFQVLDSFGKAKFDETVDIAVSLGVDPKKSDQMVRAATPLPHGLGKTVKIAVFAKGEKAQEAMDAGADFVGAEDLVEKIQGGWLEFDSAVATPDVMGIVSKVGRILGPRGVMPNPKLGTVTFDVKKIVQELKAGKVEFRTEKAALIHAPIGKRSFGPEKLKENFKVLMDAVIKAKPSSAKGVFIKGISISATQTPGVRVDTAEYR